MENKIVDSLKHLGIPIDNLEGMVGNPRKGDVDAVVKSYREFGQRKPLVARITGKNDLGLTGEVLAGNHQLMAAKKLGWEKIAVVFVNDDDITAKAFALADNKTSDMGTYEPKELEKLLASLSKDTNLLIAMSYEPEKTEKILKDIADEDRVLAEKEHGEFSKKTLKEMGDLYQDRTNRTFLAEYPVAIKKWVVATLEAFALENNIEGNSEALLLAVSKATKKEMPK